MKILQLGKLVAGLLLSAGAAGAFAAVTGTIDPTSGFLNTSAAIPHSYVASGGTYLRIAAGQATYSATLTVNGLSRRYVVIRPNPAPASAPMLLMLHPSNTLPETMANLAYADDYALTQGYWAVLPQAVGGTWKDDPTTSGADDVQFISALIDTLAKQGVDPTRVYATGYSSGGFMVERLACQLADKIAAFTIDAAELKGGLAGQCVPTLQRPKLYFLGTADSIVPYAGIYSGSAAGLWSASDTMKFWVGKQKCGGVVASLVPDRAADNQATSVQLTQYTGCAGGTALGLYTVTGGGHAWPGGITQSAGVTTQDIMATGLSWKFVAPYRR